MLTLTPTKTNLPTPQPAGLQKAANTKPATRVPSQAFKRVESLDELKLRCRIDDVTGCWIWSGAVKSRNTWPQPVTWWVSPDGKGEITQTRRVAWMLSGKRIPDGRIVFRCCDNPLCVNPKHANVGTRADAGAHLSDTGRLKGCPKRRAHAVKQFAHRNLPAEKVAHVEALLSGGLSIYAIARQERMSYRTVKKIASRLHPNCSGSAAPVLLYGASVFTLGRSL